MDAGHDENRAAFLADLHAGKHARGLMDFAISGYYGKRINNVIVFFNAGMQALRRLGLAWRKGQRTSTALRWGIYAAAPTMLIYALQAALMDDKDREEWRQRPAEKRDFHWSFKIGQNSWIDIPKPYEWGVLASGIERLFDSMDGNKHAWDSYPTSLRTALMPVKEEYMAGAFKPFLESATNYSFFTGRPIVSPYENNLDLDKRKGTAHASPIGRALQDMIGVDARKIDYVVQGTLGGYGRIATAKSGDPGWWAGAAVGLTGRSPAWESTDVQFVMDWADRRQIGGKKPIEILRRMLQKASGATGAERDALAKQAREYAGKMRAAMEANPGQWGGQKKDNE
jgi:hypothetical protein